MDLKIIISDLETLKEDFLASFYEPVKKEWYEFEVNKFTNDLYPFLKFMEGIDDYHIVFYNGIKFDTQVVEFIRRNHEKWVNKTGLEIAHIIWQFAQDVIDDSSHDVFPPFREEEISFKHIDVMEIPHFSNRAKMTSLKWLEFMMDAPSIEEMPIKHDQKGLTEKDCESIKRYCRNDIENTYRWYKHLRGEVEHEFYKGKDKIQNRLDLIESLGLPERIISWNDVKIGDEINKRGYCKLTGKTVSELYELKRKRGPTKKFTFGEVIPSYVKFTTPEMQQFHEKVSKVRVSLQDDDKQEFPLLFRSTTYTIARGGIHSTEKNRVINVRKGEILRDADIGAQYTNSIFKRNLYPSHLGPEWLTVLRESIILKDEYKKLGKDGDRKYKGLERMYKDALNGGGFGKTGEKGSWQYDPRVMYFCTIGNQFEILMLIEALELQGIHVVSANTDGILSLFSEHLNDKYYEVCHHWEKVVGNFEMGKLEYTDFDMIAQEHVNCYIGVKKNGELKVKGRFLVEDEMHKNNTDKIGRIERRAIVEYFAKRIPLDTTIRGCDDIYLFALGLKSSKNYHFQTIKGNEIEEHKKVIRFFISNKGVKLIKVKNEDSDATGADITRISKDHLVTMFNTYEEKKIEDYDLNYDFYIARAKEIVDKIEKQRKKKYIEPPKAQISLFDEKNT